MSLRSKLRCVGLTDTGKVREHNEDTIAVDADIGLLVLADGCLRVRFLLDVVGSRFYRHTLTLRVLPQRNLRLCTVGVFYRYRLVRFVYLRAVLFGR